VSVSFDEPNMVPCAGLHGPAGAGPAELSASLTIDLDSTIVPVFGRNKQGAAFGYTKIRGYHPQLATCAQTGQVMFSRLRAAARHAGDRHVHARRNPFNGLIGVLHHCLSTRIKYGENVASRPSTCLASDQFPRSEIEMFIWDRPAPSVARRPVVMARGGRGSGRARCSAAR
jgi:hypothetical protein